MLLGPFPSRSIHHPRSVCKFIMPAIKMHESPTSRNHRHTPLQTMRSVKSAVNRPCLEVLLGHLARLPAAKISCRQFAGNLPCLKVLLGDFARLPAAPELPAKLFLVFLLFHPRGIVPCRQNVELAETWISVDPHSSETSFGFLIPCT